MTGEKYHGSFTLNDRPFLLEDLPPISAAQSAYEKETLKFIGKWIAGQTKFLVPTSGSTGKPKLSYVSRKRMLMSAKQTEIALGLKAGMKSFHCLPNKYVAGKLMIVRALEIGMQMTFVEPTSNPLEDIGMQHTFDFGAFVPLQVENALRSNTVLLERFQLLLLGGAKIGPDLEKQLQRIRPMAYHSFGMTETVTHFALRKINEADRSKLYTLLDSYQIKLDERGCMAIKGPITTNKWIQTNDQVEIIGDKQFRWLGRNDFIVNVGGVKINLEALESKVSEILKAHDLHQGNLILFPEDDPKLGQKISLLLETEGIDKASIRKVLSTGLKKFEVPQQVYEIPKMVYTETMKVKRAASVNQINTQ